MKVGFHVCLRDKQKMMIKKGGQKKNKNDRFLEPLEDNGVLQNHNILCGTNFYE